MNDFDWNKFLRQWNDDVFASAAIDLAPADARAAKWLGLPPATEKQLAAAEGRLGIALPPSYRSFLAVSDGWKYVCHAVPQLWGAAQLDWFRNNEAGSVEIWGRATKHEPLPDDEYFTYEISEVFRPEHVRETLQIGPMGDAAFLLLNPQVIGKDGEWECWMLASWIPGVHRYRSFREMFELEYARLIGEEQKQKIGIINGLPDEFIGGPGTPERHKKKPVLSSDGPAVAELLAALEDRELAFRLFPKAKSDPGRQRPPGQTDEREARRRVAEALGYRRDAKAVPALIKLLAEKEHRLVRRAAIGSLGKIGGREAIEALFAELDKGDSIAAMHELKKLAPDRLKEPLLRELQQASLLTFPAAAGVLAELKEKRALPILAGIIKRNSKEPRDSQNALLAAKLIGSFDLDGLEVLKELLASKDPSVRRWAVLGIGEIQRPQAREVMRGLLQDDDPAIREDAKRSMMFLPGPR